MDQSDIVRRIDDLVAAEHALEGGHEGVALTDDEAARRRQIEVALDQCWDLLRQRRARRRVGEDPDSADVRPEDVVEGYQQ